MILDHRHAALLLVTLVAACRFGDPDKDTSTTTAPLSNDSAICQSRPAAERLLALEQLKAGQQITCARSGNLECPCGSFCNGFGFCQTQCAPADLDAPPADDLTCTGSNVCSPDGHCGTGPDDPGPQERLTLHVPPTISANTATGPVTVTVAVSVDANSLAFIVNDHPATVAYQILPTDPDDTSPLPSVQCSPDDFPDSPTCEIDGGWQFNPGTQGLHSSPKHIFVTIPQSATTKTWLLRAGSEWATAPTTSAVQAVPVTFPAADGGTYTGTVAWDGGTLTLPIRAVVTSDKLALIDPTGVLLPGGQALFSRLPTKTTMLAWLTSTIGGTTSLYNVRMDVSLTKPDPTTGLPVPGYDPSTGRLAGTFQITDEQGNGGLGGTLALQRIDNVVSCTSSAACGPGAYCSLALAACLPGSGPPPGMGIMDIGPVAIPSTSLPSAMISAWAPKVSSLVAANPGMLGGAGRTAMQSAYCFQAPGQGQVAGFLDYSPASLQVPSEDLGCRLSPVTAPYAQVTFPFANTVKDTGPETNGDALTLLTNCLTELAAPPTGNLATDMAPTPQCVSLGRFFAAMSPVDDTETGKKLSTQILRQWAGLNAYIASTTVQDQAADNVLNAVVADDATRFATAVDRVQQDLLVFLDPSIRSRYLEGITWPAVALAPDYRLQRPVARWSFNTTTSPVPDAEGGPIGLSVPAADLVGNRLQTLGTGSCQSTDAVSLDDGVTHNRFSVAFVLNNGGTSTNGPVTLFEKDGPDVFKIQGTFAGTHLTVVASDSAGRSATFPMIDLCAGLGGGCSETIMPGFVYFVDDNGAYQLVVRHHQAIASVAPVSLVGGGPRWGAPGTVSLPCGVPHSCTAYNTCSSYDLNFVGDGADTTYSANNELGWFETRTCTCQVTCHGGGSCSGSSGSDSECNQTALTRRSQLAGSAPSWVLGQLSVVGTYTSWTDTEDGDGEIRIDHNGECDLSESGIPAPHTRAKPVCGCQPNLPFLTSQTTFDEVSVWNRPLLPDELDAMYNAYALDPAKATVTPPPPPPAAPVPPAPQFRLPGAEQAGGLPPQLVEAAAAYAQLLTAYVTAASGTIYAQCYQSDPATGNPSAMLQTVQSRVGPGLRLIRVLQDQAAELAGVPGAASSVWYGRYQADLQQLAGQLHGTLAALHQVTGCKNPLGIDEGEIPLYIGDASGLAANERFFAGTHALVNLVEQTGSSPGELTLAATAFQAAHDAYVAQQQSQYQITIAAADRTTTLDNLHAQYDSTLRKYCGVPTGADVLDRFTNHTLNATNCYLATERAGCANAASLAIKDVPAQCLRGDMGAHILAMQTAAIDVQNAKNAQDRALDLWNGDEAYCTARAAFDNDTNALVAAHFAMLENLRQQQEDSDDIAGWFSTALAVVVIVAAAVVTDGASLAPTLAALGAEQTINSNDTAMVDRQFGSDIATENDRYQMLLGTRAALKDSVDCFHKADNDKFAFDQATDTIRRAVQTAGAASSAFSDDRDQVQGLVDEFQGRQSLINSIDRTPPHLHFWLDNAIANYQVHMRNARRLAYLAVRTYEYEAQVSSTQRQAVLAARTPSDLQAAMSNLNSASAAFAGQMPNQGTPGETATVFSLRDDVFDLAGLITPHAPPGQPGPQTSSQAFTTILASDSSKLYDLNGNLLGHAIRFSLAGGSAWNQGTCAERIWRITPSVATDNTSPPTGPNATRLVLYQQNTFGSQVCADPTNPDVPLGTTQMVRYQPVTDLLTGNDSQPFSSPEGFSSINIDYVADLSVHDLRLAQQGDNPGGFAAGFAGRGMIGNYILLFPACTPPTCNGDSQGWTDHNLNHVVDVLLRFDVVGASNNAQPQSLSPIEP